MINPIFSFIIFSISVIAEYCCSRLAGSYMIISPAIFLASSPAICLNLSAEKPSVSMKMTFLPFLTVSTASWMQMLVLPVPDAPYICVTMPLSNPPPRRSSIHLHPHGIRSNFVISLTPCSCYLLTDIFYCFDRSSAPLYGRDVVHICLDEASIIRYHTYHRYTVFIEPVLQFFCFFSCF